MSSTGHLPWIIRLRAGWRLLLAMTVALLGYFWTTEAVLYRTRALICWDLGAYTYLALAFAAIFLSGPAATRARSRMQDSSRYVIFTMVVIASVMSLIAIGFLIGNIKELTFWERATRLILTILALTASWLLIHTLFAFHYARRFYGGAEGLHSEPRGLEFPETPNPDFRDFAYFAFVVGMTSQTSDVAVTGRQMRSITLTHGVFSFVFNIAILTMSINIIAGVI